MSLPIYELEDKEGIEEQLRIEENFAIVYNKERYCFLFRQREGKAPLVYVYKRYMGKRKDTYLGLSINLNHEVFSRKVIKFADDLKKEIAQTEKELDLYNQIIPRLTAKEGVAILIEENQKLVSTVNNLSKEIENLKEMFSQTVKNPAA